MMKKTLLAAVFALFATAVMAEIPAPATDTTSELSNLSEPHMMRSLCICW